MASLPLATTAGDQAETEFSETQRPSPNGQYLLEQKVVCFLLHCPFEIKKEKRKHTGQTAGRMGRLPRETARRSGLQRAGAFPFGLSLFGQAEVVDDGISGFRRQVDAGLGERQPGPGGSRAAGFVETRKAGWAQGRCQAAVASWHRKRLVVPTHHSSGPGLYQPVVEGQRLHNGGVSLGAFLELLKS